jgi:hypothetical protein
MSTDAKTGYESWSLIEIMGHQRLAGMVTETTVAGAAMLRVDVPEIDGVPGFTTFLGAGSIYRLTPVSEDIARRMAVQLRIKPVHAYEMPGLPAPAPERNDHDEDDDFEDEDD